MFLSLYGGAGDELILGSMLRGQYILSQIQETSHCKWQWLRIVSAATTSI